MNLKRPRLGAWVACAIAALGTSALLAGVLASPAVASGGRAQASKPAHPPVLRLYHRSANPARLPKSAPRPLRPPNRSAHTAADSPLDFTTNFTLPQRQPDFTTHVTPLNTIAFFSPAGLVFDMEGASTAPGGQLIDWFSEGAANQMWTFHNINPGRSVDVYTIVNQNSGLCLTTEGIAGERVVQETCVGNGTGTSPAQMWFTELSPFSTGGSTIDNPASNLYLDVDQDNPDFGAWIITWPFNGGQNQYFGAT